MSKRGDSVNYITSGLLMVIAGIFVLFIKLATSFVFVYWLIGAILILLGISFIKKKTLLGLLLLVIGALTLLGYSTHFLGRILSIIGWISFIGGAILIVLGVFRVKKTM